MKTAVKNSSSLLWPLGSDPESLFVGGSTVGKWRERERPPGDFWTAEAAWISACDWARLKDASPGTVLTDAKGETLGGTGSGESAQISASTDSFLLQYPWDLLQLNELLLRRLTSSGIEGELSEAAHVDGILLLGAESRVLPGVYVEGTVMVGANCKIGPNCYLRGNSAVGDGCHIGQAVEIKNSVIGPGCHVAHLSYIGDSILGKNVNFGAGTITANLRHDGRNQRSLVDGDLVETNRRKFGAIVGDGVHTGIHTSIYPGRKLGPGVSTRPGEVVNTNLK
jgi:bifunctional UDP-N-acetylglucosamine pyrophosphorylase/glucosamine-1-phosphate N-acetyltransferase